MLFRFLSIFVLLLVSTRLSAQALYSIDGTGGPPTDEETYYVELINRARADPTAEGVRLRTTTDANVQSSASFFSTNLELMAQEFAAISAAPPVAFHARLLDAARGHSHDQFDNQFQSHTGSSGSSIANRATTAGYLYQNLSENVYSFAKSVFHGHAGFQIDWGNDAGGMQTGRGHRVNIHTAAMREVGIGVVLGTNGSIGPQVVTQNFGTRFSALPLLTGVAFYDLSGDNFYTAGEGLGGLAVTVTGANFAAVTTASGAFTVPLPGNGTFAVRFSGLGIDQTSNVTVSSSQNVKVDLQRTFSPPLLFGPGAPVAGAAATYSFPSVPGATRHELVRYVRDTTTPAETADDTSGVTLATAAGYSVLQTAIRSQGAAAFNLRVISGTGDQFITLNRRFFGRPGATLTFASRLALASRDESAHVQVSTDDGTTWSSVFSQTGTGGAGETAFVNQSLSLESLEGRLFQLRLRYAFTSGSFFTGGGAVGWYIDDLRLTNCESVTADPTIDLGAATIFGFTPAATSNYLLQVTSFNLAHRLGAGENRLVTATNATAPALSRQPGGAATASGGSVDLVAETSTPGATFQWQRNGINVSGATGGTLNLGNVQPANTGLYAAVVGSGAGSTLSEPASVAVTTNSKVIGTGSEIAPNINHPNGNVFDQILLEGVAASFTADHAENQITRLSYVDLNNDIVQVEFSGPGTVSIVLDESSGPAVPVNYVQGTTYMKGHAGIVVTGASENTHMSVFSVGRGNAVNQGLFKDNVTYDGFADIAFIAIQSSDGKFGSLRTANASYFATNGPTGVYAPNVEFIGPVFVGDISASGEASPVLIIGSGNDVRINGGSLRQANGRAIRVAGLTQLRFVDGSSSHHTAADPHLLPAQANQGHLEQNGTDVTVQFVVNPGP